MKKSKKTIILAILSVVFIYNTTLNVKALESNYVLENSGTLEMELENTKQLEIIKKMLAERQKELNNFAVPQALPSYIKNVLLMYPNYKQEKNYYCGPAVVKQAVQFLKGSSQSQDTYASHFGIVNGGGTAVIQITNELKSELNTKNVMHELQSTTLSNVQSNLKAYADLFYVTNKPIILHARTKSLYTYNGRDTGHYLTAIGYGGWGSGINNISDIVYVDTWTGNYGLGSVFGQHTETVENVAKAVLGRYLIMFA